MGSSVVRRSDSSEAFLPSCVPYLQLHVLPIKRDVFDFLGGGYEVYTDSVEEVLCEVVLCVPHKETRLPHARVADQEKLEEVVTE